MSASVESPPGTVCDHANLEKRHTASSTSSRRTCARAPSTAGVARLDVLLVTGQRHTFDLDADMSVASAKEHILLHWPQDWPARPETPSQVQLLHLGHFLADSAPLKGQGASRGVRAGAVTVVHLLIKATPSSKAGADTVSDVKRKEKLGEDAEAAPGGCRCVIC